MRKIGRSSYYFDNVYLQESYTVVGNKEFEGPLGKYFDFVYKKDKKDKSFEQIEENMMKEAINGAICKNKINIDDISLYIGGDLNNQISSTSYSLKRFDIPTFGIYSACATINEALIQASMLVDSINNKDYLVLCGTSSNNQTSERQFRNPNEYAGQKANTHTTTVSSASCVLVSNKRSNIKITRATIGKVIDSTLLDQTDMGRIMAPSAAITYYTHLSEFNLSNEYYDLILTGDLSTYGTEAFLKICNFNDIEINKQNYSDTGLLIYDLKEQKGYAGGSGCGCVACVSLSYVTYMLRKGIINKVLILATGALLSSVKALQKESIPSICHAIGLERVLL